MTTRTYDEMAAEALEYFGNQDYGAALDLLTREGVQYPEMAHMIYYLRSCSAARAGRTELAIGLIEEALGKGIFYGERAIRETPSWQPLQGSPEFERVAAMSKARAAEAHTGALLITAEPEGGCSEERPCPTMVALHGNANDGASAIAGWRPIVSRGWLLAAIQSSQLMATKAYMWDDQQTALRDINEQYAELARRYAIDTKRLVIAGFSLGGETALLAALSGATPARGFILLGPGGPTTANPDEWLPFIKQGADRGLRGYVLLGERDLGIPHEAIRAVVDSLNAHGIPCQLEILPNLAHEYPPDPGPILERALAFIEPEHKQPPNI
jgi:dienelactone hydrolase